MSENGRNLVYLITGGCGFLGKHLLDVLMEKEEKLAEVRLFDKHIDRRFYEQRSTDYNSVLEATKGADVVIHSASLVDVWHKIPETLIYSVNVTGIYGEGHQLIKDFYNRTVERGGLVIGGVPEHIEHGRVYAGNVAWMHVLAARALRENPKKVGGEAFFCYDESPYKSYEEFNMMLLSEFNFRKLRMSPIILWFLAILNDVLRWILSPIYNYTPMLNQYTLAVVSTTFTVKTDKAQRYFQYQPLYDWNQCLARTQAWIRTFQSDKPKDC
ncbi:hypothetical protein GOODEAATRI_008800 [Goodea atripinnis]|uniref:3-beta hydroxysteroid dehydrogenase/isomerase domain-containing protein n=1 Tax=Goodea atripinnis TaxID=208336 RepID=A0ABV0MQG1_9TELE